jgi:hypothetical protein
VLLLAGLIGLLVSLTMGVLRFRQGQRRAGLLSVGLAVAACALIAIGMVRLSLAARSATSGQAAFSDALGTVIGWFGIPGFPANRLASLATVAGSVILILAGLILFRSERRHQDFDPSVSPGLLNTGMGIFTLVAALVIPLIPPQASGTAPGVALGLTPTSGLVAARVMRASSTPTQARRPSPTPTAPPTLMPTVSETPILLYTQIAYVAGNRVSTTTNCTLIARTMLNLRGDPSTTQPGIGRVFAGSLLPVTGRSTDKQWWRVVNDSQGSAVEGGVSAENPGRCDSLSGRWQAPLGLRLHVRATTQPFIGGLPMACSFWLSFCFLSSDLFG